MSDVPLARDPAADDPAADESAARDPDGPARRHPTRLGHLYGNAPLLLCLAVLGWSGNFVVGRLVGGSVPPTQLAFVRWFIAAALVLPFALPHLRRDAPVVRRHWRLLAVLSLCGVAIFNAFVYRGLQTTTAVNGLLLQSVGPVLIVALSFLAHREAPSRWSTAGLVVSLAGVWAVVSRGDPFAASLKVTWGDAWILAAVASYAVYTVVLRSKPALHPLSLLAVTFVVGDVILAPFALVEYLDGQHIPATLGAVAAVGYVGLIPSLVSYFCYNRGVELIGGARAGQFIHLMPVFGAVLAYVFIGESLAAYHLIGAAIIALGIWLSGRR